MNVSRRKDKTAYFCSQCGSEHPKWQGQCRDCGAWNSLIEERVPVKAKSARVPASSERRRIADIADDNVSGYVSGVGEFDRVLGGQLLPGMTVLLAGEPGIGKSTLMLQVAEAYSRQGLSVLYVTGEESLPQVKRRSQRLDVSGDNITAVNSVVLEEVVAALNDERFAVVCVDSIQTLASAQFDSPPGTVGQVREVANQLITLAKARGYALFLVGHVTKEGLVAGPKVLEHLVDTVVNFEGETSHLYRLLRVGKNRFGSASEIGLFEMQPEGLVEVTNPSSFFLAEGYETARPGAVVAGICEGNRPLLVEVQALVTAASYGNPQRVAGGIDNRKLSLLLAVLEKRCGYPMGSHDVFVSVAGGLRLTEPALDLPILLAIVSSLMNRPAPGRMAAAGEVGLSGEVRAVSQIERRVSESARLGFASIVVPEANRSQLRRAEIEVIPVSDIQTAIDRIMG